MQIVFNAQQDRKVCLGVLRSVSLELKSYLFISQAHPKCCIVLVLIIIYKYRMK